MYVHETQVERFADAGARCPQHTQEQTIALRARGIDDGKIASTANPSGRCHYLAAADLEVLDRDPNDAEAGPLVKQEVGQHGDIRQLLASCEAIAAYNGDNYYPLLTEVCDSWLAPATAGRARLAKRALERPRAPSSFCVIAFDCPSTPDISIPAALQIGLRPGSAT